LSEFFEIVWDWQTCTENRCLDLVEVPSLEIPAVRKNDTVINGETFYVSELHQPAGIR
jgi:hypothetical protein